MAMFAATARSFKNFMMDAAAAASSPDVGSSRNSTSGFDSSAMARESLRFCPPDRPEKNAFPTFVSAQPVSPMVASTASTRAVFSSLGMSKYRSAANATVSRHVRNAQCLSCCGTVAQNFVKMSLFIVSPLSRTSPTESPFLLSSVRRSMRHVFPAPEGPHDREDLAAVHAAGDAVEDRLDRLLRDGPRDEVLHVPGELHALLDGVLDVLERELRVFRLVRRQELERGVRPAGTPSSSS